MTNKGKCKLKSEIKGCKSNISSIDGCLECEDGYYLFEKECYQCPNECTTCINNDSCTSCKDEYVLINDKCTYYNNIKNCKSTNNSKCSKCSFWHKPNETGTECETHVVWWLILIIIIFIIIIITINIIIIYKLINYIQNKKNKEEIRSSVCLFKMNRSNIKFTYKINKLIISNLNTIEYAEQIPVNKETRELICLGN